MQSLVERTQCSPAAGRSRGRLQCWAPRDAGGAGVAAVLGFQGCWGMREGQG